MSTEYFYTAQGLIRFRNEKSLNFHYEFGFNEDPDIVEFEDISYPDIFAEANMNTIAGMVGNSFCINFGDVSMLQLIKEYKGGSSYYAFARNIKKYDISDIDYLILGLFDSDVPYTDFDEEPFAIKWIKYDFANQKIERGEETEFPQNTYEYARWCDNRVKEIFR